MWYDRPFMVIPFTMSSVIGAPLPYCAAACPVAASPKDLERGEFCTRISCAREGRGVMSRAVAVVAAAAAAAAAATLVAAAVAVAAWRTAAIDCVGPSLLP